MMKLKLLKETHSKIKTFYCCKENWRKRYILVEKIISGDKFNNPYQNSIEKNPEIIKTVESNYKISRSVYQFVFADVTNIFIEYIYLWDQDETFKLNEDIEFKGWGAKHISEIENDFELLTIFQRFCYRNERLPLTIGLLVVTDG